MSNGNAAPAAATAAAPLCFPGQQAAKTPDKPAFIVAADDSRISFAMLEARANQLAHLLRKLGLRPGDDVAFCLENHPRFFEICWAAQRSGLYYTAISSRLTAGEAAYIVNDCGAKAFISSMALAELAGKLVEQTPNVAARLLLDGTIPGYQGFEAAVAAMPETPIADQTEGADMLYSSGTTGRPKGVRFPLAGVPYGTVPNLPRLAERYRITSDAVFLSPAPFYHSAPIVNMMAYVRLGATAVLVEHFDAEDFLRLVERYRVTHALLVPTMFVRLLKLPEAVRRKYDLSSLQVAVHGAAPCPVAIKQQMIAWWGPCIEEYYAGTERNGSCTIGSEEWLQRPGTVGKPAVGSVHILDDEGNELPPLQNGTIYFGGGNPFAYHNDPEKTAASRAAGGRTTLGDIGYLDADGYLYLTDRKANMIITGGVNVYPQEAENLLVSHPKVADVAVFGVPNEDFGEEVKAVVQPVDMAAAGPALEAELIAFCRQHLSPIKCPRSVDFEAELPRHPTGKLYKRLLRDRYWAGRQSKLV